MLISQTYISASGKKAQGSGIAGPETMHAATFVGRPLLRLEEIEAIKLESKKTIDMVQFVEAEQIDARALVYWAVGTGEKRSMDEILRNLAKDSLEGCEREAVAHFPLLHLRVSPGQVVAPRRGDNRGGDICREASACIERVASRALPDAKI
jgi:hypothetical protein